MGWSSSIKYSRKSNGLSKSREVKKYNTSQSNSSGSDSSSEEKRTDAMSLKYRRKRQEQRKKEQHSFSSDDSEDERLSFCSDTSENKRKTLNTKKISEQDSSDDTDESQVEKYASSSSEDESDGSSKNQKDIPNKDVFSKYQNMCQNVLGMVRLDPIFPKGNWKHNPNKTNKLEDPKKRKDKLVRNVSSYWKLPYAPPLFYDSSLRLDPYQWEYVSYPYLVHTVLDAPPGSGKTRCALERMRCMVQNKMMTKEGLFVVSFTHKACTEASERVLGYKDYKNWAVPENLITFDSLAQKVLSAIKDPKAGNVELLSLALLKLLENSSPKDIKKLPFISDMKCSFVDEVQDIDGVQYQIIQQLIEKAGVIFHFIGDPNQALYRFRGGSSKYMFKFLSDYNATHFHLLYNYRSSANIVKFYKGLRSMVFKDIIPTHPDGEPVQILVNTRKKIHIWLISFLRKNLHQLEEICIMCPTKGTGSVKDVGLSVIGNILHSKNIPFIQHYDESGTDEGRSKIHTSIKGRVNLITYIGSKGMEWKIVIVMDFHNLLYNRLPSSMVEYWDQKNLLYVACSRAKEKMFICSYKDKAIHPWISKADPNAYSCNQKNYNLKRAIFPMEVQRQKRPYLTMDINSAIDSLKPQVLDEIYDRLGIRVTERKLMIDRTSQFSKLNNSALFSMFAKEVFLMQLCQRQKQPWRTFEDLDHFLSCKLIRLKDRLYSKVRTFILRNKTMTWEGFRKNDIPIAQDVQEAILEKFDQSIPFQANLITTSEAKEILETNRSHIHLSYEAFRESYSWEQAYSHLFYLTLIRQSISTGHYYHMSESYVQMQLQSVMQLLPMFVELDLSLDHVLQREKQKLRYVNPQTKIHDFIQFSKSIMYEKLGLIGVADLQIGNSLVELKCTSELYIKNYLSLLLKHVCLATEKNRMLSLSDKLETYFQATSKIINPVKGVEWQIELKVSKANLCKILNLIADSANLRFRELRVAMYFSSMADDKALQSKKQQENSLRKNLYCEDSCRPYYLEMRERQLGMLLYRHHINPGKNFTEKQERYYQITNNELYSFPSIDIMTQQVNQQLRNILTAKFYHMAQQERIFHTHRAMIFGTESMPTLEMLEHPPKTSYYQIPPAYLRLQLVSCKLPQISRIKSKRLHKKVIKYLLEQK
jgi:hypothetical protein